MKESGKNSWLLKKSYEIAYAVYRLAATIEKGFGDHIKNAAIAFLGATAAGNYKEAIKNLDTLEYLTRFGMDVNIMGMANGEILLREIKGIRAGFEEKVYREDIQKSDMGGRVEEIDLSKFFSKEIRQEPAHETGKMETGKIELPDESGNGGNVKSEARQGAILERIRQIGNCRIKDIQDILPDSSERTIRYDLQTLTEQKLIERIGAGGPSVFYRIRQPEGPVENIG